MDHDGFTPPDLLGEVYWNDTYDNADILRRFGLTDFSEREELEMQLEDDCFQVRCDLYIKKEFPAVLPPDLHRPLSSGVHRYLCTVYTP